MSGGIDKLSVYRGLEIPEVLIWQDDNLSLYDLQGEAYQEVSQSQFFPGLDFSLLAQYVKPCNQSQAVKEFLEAIRAR
jgi:hypothetical protein